MNSTYSLQEYTIFVRDRRLLILVRSLHAYRPLEVLVEASLVSALNCSRHAVAFGWKWGKHVYVFTSGTCMHAALSAFHFIYSWCPYARAVVLACNGF